MGAALTARPGLRPQRPAVVKGRDLPLSGQPDVRVRAEAPDDARRQRLARLGQIGRRGAEPVHAQTGLRVDPGALVGVDEVAVLVLDLPSGPGRDDVVQTIEHLHGERALSRAAQLAAAHQTEAGARRPCRLEGQAETVVVLPEDDLVAQAALGDAASPPHRTPLRGLPGPPVRGRVARRPRALDHGQGAGRARHVHDLVLGQVREDRVVGVASSGGQCTGGGDERPEVAHTDEGHQERGHGIDVGDDGVLRLAERERFGGSLNRDRAAGRRSIR